MIQPSSITATSRNEAGALKNTINEEEDDAASVSTGVATMKATNVVVGKQRERIQPLESDCLIMADEEVRRVERHEGQDVIDAYTRNQAREALFYFEEIMRYGTAESVDACIAVIDQIGSPEAPIVEEAARHRRIDQIQLEYIVSVPIDFPFLFRGRKPKNLVKRHRLKRSPPNEQFAYLAGKFKKSLKTLPWLSFHGVRGTPGLGLSLRTCLEHQRQANEPPVDGRTCPLEPGSSAGPRQIFQNTARPILVENGLPSEFVDSAVASFTHETHFNDSESVVAVRSMEGEMSTLTPNTGDNNNNQQG